MSALDLDAIRARMKREITNEGPGNVIHAYCGSAPDGNPFKDGLALIAEIESLRATVARVTTVCDEWETYAERTRIDPYKSDMQIERSDAALDVAKEVRRALTAPERKADTNE